MARRAPSAPRAAGPTSLRERLGAEFTKSMPATMEPAAGRAHPACSLIRLLSTTAAPQRCPGCGQRHRRLRAGGERRDLHVEGQDRLRRRHRGAQYRPPPSQGDLLRRASSSSASPIRPSRCWPMSPISRSANGSTSSPPSRARPRPCSSPPGRGDGDAIIARAATKRTGVIAFNRRLSWPHLADHGDDRQDAAL